MLYLSQRIDRQPDKYVSFLLCELWLAIPDSSFSSHWDIDNMLHHSGLKGNEKG